ncbi:MAG: hypothetical protein ABSG22_02110 [Sedimentisphaerales bacterium]|jgi:hypothetical protein
MCIQEISSIVTSITTLIGVLAVVATAMITVCAYKQNTAIKRLEFIDKLYDQIDKKENTKFIDLLLKNDKLEIIPESSNAYLLENLLTSFDKVCNYYEQKIINKKLLCYIACEVLDLYNHPSVIKYINKVNEKRINRKYNKDIILYSGFLWLGEYLSKECMTLPPENSASYN